MLRKIVIAALVASFMAATALAAIASPPALIPLPQKMERA
jgi:hypothetical protein